VKEKRGWKEVGGGKRCIGSKRDLWEKKEKGGGREFHIFPASCWGNIRGRRKRTEEWSSEIETLERQKGKTC